MKTSLKAVLAAAAHRQTWKKVRVFYLVPIVLLTSCNAYQLTSVTTSGAAAVEPIYKQQILSNLAATIDQPGYLPFQSALQTGTMQGSSGVTPSVTFPLTSMFAHAVAPMGVTNTTTTAGAGATLGGSYGFSLNYIVQPETDILLLTNLRAVYMAAICRSLEDTTARSTDTSLNTACHLLEDGTSTDKAYDITQHYMPPRIFNPKNNQLVLNPYFLHPPFCVLCLPLPDPKNDPSHLNDNQLSIDESQRSKLVPNKVFSHRWLYWSGSHIAQPSNTVPLGEANGKTFYADNYQNFANFILTTLPLPQSPTLYETSGAPGAARKNGAKSPAAGGRGSALDLSRELSAPFTIAIPGSPAQLPPVSSQPGTTLLPSP